MGPGLKVKIMERVLKINLVFQNSPNGLKTQEVLKIWISDDKNKLLLKVEAEIWAGSVKAEISEYKNLKHPISFFQTKKEKYFLKSF